MNTEQLAAMARVAIRRAAGEFAVKPSECYRPPSGKVKAWTAQRHAMRYLRDDGCTMDEIASVFQICRETVRAKLKKTPSEVTK